MEQRAYPGVGTASESASHGAELLANDELETRPDVVDSADFDVDEAEGQCDLTNDIFRDIGGDFARLLGPGDPDRAVGRQPGQALRKFVSQFGGLRGEEMDEVD